MKHPYLVALLAVIGTAFALVPLAGNAKPDKEIHLIPRGFAGHVYIIFNAHHGQPPHYDEQGHRVYEIPSSGLLLTQLQENEGYFGKDDVRYFTVDASGRTKEITSRWHRPAREMPDDIRDNQTIIFSGSSGVIDLFGIQCHIVFVNYYIGTKNDALSDRGLIDLDEHFNNHPDQCPQQVTNQKGTDLF